MLSVANKPIVPSVVMLSVIILTVVMAGAIVLSVVMLNVVKASVIELSVVMLNVVMAGAIVLSVAASLVFIQLNNFNFLKFPFKNKSYIPNTSFS